ncbi:MAG: hypothetical protein KGH93_01065 [Patescibacteria group bacterium]|nr:hypothetical protein [Patescibacteria group bacterium]
MKKFIPTFIALVLAILPSAASAQDFSAVGTAIDLANQEKAAAQSAIAAEKARFSTSTGTASSSSRDLMLRLAIERKLGHALPAPRMDIAAGFENAVASLENIASRLSSRLSDMQAAGIDTASSSALFTTVQADVGAASSDVTALEELLAATTSVATKNASFDAIRAASTAAKTALETAQKDIIAVIMALKQASGMTTDSATSTDQSASSSGM